MNCISCKGNLVKGNVNHVVDFDGHIIISGGKNRSTAYISVIGFPEVIPHKKKLYALHAVLFAGLSLIQIFYITISSIMR